MKQLLILFSMSLLLLACNRSRYVNLVSGESVKLERDSKTGLMVDSRTNEPVYMYIDTRTHDTIYGATGQVINGHVVRTEDGKFKYDGDEEYKFKTEGYKKKVDDDGIKIKTDDKKIKIDEDGKKVKSD